MRDIIVGIDGGGTKTKAAAIDNNGKLIAQSESGSMNYNFLSMSECVANVCEAIRGLNLGADCQIIACAIGDASIDDEVPHNLSEQFISEIRAQAGLNNDVPVLLKSDVFMSLYGLTQGSPGVLIISGTGSMGIGIDKQGQIVTAGGWGRPGTDKGSGYDIAVAGLSAVFEASDGTMRQTKLTEKALEFYKVDKPRELIGIFNSDDCTRSDIAAFAPLVAQCAKEGDTAARIIISTAAEDLAAYACALIKRINYPACNVGIYGGVFQNNLDIQADFKDLIRRDFPEVIVKFPDIPPEIAAAHYAINSIK